ncbi:serine hydrolase domain-containing protein [Plantactinospora soyae]|uniref:CubicO group peptidase (Beta-lactamase class C family) n=1 Tax=Plantactinospora soyae TaxID=1544732 RepID=A0A927M5U0_9ACTN|nr:serine hydrolase domain-containing protein [Plantactinospora soyae]MBE1488557.1 CubicO group peptidase (beta-lactamase class C family) [Plantactinospora soyae]
MESVPGINRRRLVGWGGLAAAGAAAGVPLVGAGPGHAAPASTDPVALFAPEPSGHERIPPDTRPGGAYDRYVAKLAAQDRFSGVVLLSHRGRTVLSRSYGMADREKGIRNHEGVAVNLGSAVKPFSAVAVLQLAQRNKLRLSDTVGTYLTGFATEIAEQVTIHHLLTSTAGLNHPEMDLRRVFHSREEVHEFYQQWSRQARLEAAPGTRVDNSGAVFAIAAQIVEAVSGTTYWDYVHEHIFGRCGMTGSAFYTRPQWLTDEHIAHSYMTLEDGSRVDAVRNLDKGSPSPYEPGKNPGRNFIDYAGDGGFATAPDLVRFAHALRDCTVLDRPYVDLLCGAKIPQGKGKDGGPPPAHPSFMAYAMPAKLINGHWVYGRGGANPGSVANWHIYPATGWVSVILGNYDSLPVQDIIQQEMQAILGQD